MESSYLRGYAVNSTGSEPTARTMVSSFWTGEPRWQKEQPPRMATHPPPPLPQSSQRRKMESVEFLSFTAVTWVITTSRRRNLSRRKMLSFPFREVVGGGGLVPHVACQVGHPISVRMVGNRFQDLEFPIPLLIGAHDRGGDVI